MSTDYTDLQLDALRELANIGSGNAATALADMLGRSVELAVPRALALPLHRTRVAKSRALQRLRGDAALMAFIHALAPPAAGPPRRQGARPMSRSRISTEEAAARLAEALGAQDELSHERAEALIPALLDAERAGEDVDRDPAFAALLRHLDRCERCLSLYEQLAEDIEAIVGDAEAPPAAAPAPPQFFLAPVPIADHVLLQVVRGLARRFTLTLDLPRLAPSLATLSGPQRPLFSDVLRQVEGAPFLALTAGRDAEGLWLQAAVREPGRRTVWRLQLELGDRSLTASTDPRGIARFALPPDAPLGELRLRCEELPGAEDEVAQDRPNRSRYICFVLCMPLQAMEPRARPRGLAQARQQRAAHSRSRGLKKQ